MLSCNSLSSKLAISPWKTDFAYLTKSSIAWRLVMVELEHPHKPIFKTSSSHVAFSATMNDAIAQIDQWRDTWDTHREQIIRRLEPLVVPAIMRRNAMTAHYVLVIGRDHELAHNDARACRLAKLMKDKDLHVLTYDTLLRTYDQGRGYPKCILSPTATGYCIKHVEGEPDHLFGHVYPSTSRYRPKLRPAWSRSATAFRLGATASSWCSTRSIRCGAPTNCCSTAVRAR